MFDRKKALEELTTFLNNYQYEGMCDCMKVDINGTVFEINLKEKELKDLLLGQVFKIGKEKFIVLEHFDDGTTACIRKDLFEEEMKFGSDYTNNIGWERNNWKTCDLRTWLNTTYSHGLENLIGKDNVVEFEQDLVSLDGLTDYGKVIEKVSLLTYDQYKKYRNLLGEFKEKLWWLITPWSTISNNRGYDKQVCIVVHGGVIDSFNAENDSYYLGVRPIVHIKSNITQFSEVAHYE